jgi:hypothetical protein
VMLKRPRSSQRHAVNSKRKSVVAVDLSGPLLRTLRGLVSAATSACTADGQEAELMSGVVGIKEE